MKKTSFIALGMIFGGGLGIIFGVAFNHIEYGLPIGTGIGMLFGRFLQKKYPNCNTKDK